MSPTRSITNLRFADDILLIARTQHQITNMMRDLKQAAETVGLSLHAGKTKILSNTTKATGRQKDPHVTIDGMQIQILPR
eukprot:501030-Karenia_brevis.AAC.1